MNRTGISIRLGLLGLRRLGLLALAGLVLGLVLLSNGLQQRSAVKAEKQQPILLTASCASDADALLADVRKLDGVSRAAAGIQLQTNIVLGDYTCSLSAAAVTEGWLTEVDEGTVYPDQSAMPYLVLNRAALESFADDRQHKADADSLNWQNQTVTVNGMTGQICGLLEDGSETPCVWLSAAAGEELLLFNQTIPEYTLLFVQTENADAAAEVEQQLYAKGCSVTGGVSAFTGGWEQELFTARLYILSALAVLIFALAMLAERTRRDLAVNEAEYRFLRYNGMSANALRLLIASRIAAYLLLAVLLSLLCRWVLQIFKA